jgi:hypothetical protein
MAPADQAGADLNGLNIFICHFAGRFNPEIIDVIRSIRPRRL